MELELERLKNTARIATWAICMESRAGIVMALPRGREQKPAFDAIGVDFEKYARIVVVLA